MFDVGGQRSERKKWIHCFDNVTAILFVVSIAEYDQVLEEDKNVNRMKESMELFENIVNNQYFKRKSFICFFNKKDLFETKIKETPLTICFPQYQGRPASYIDAIDFIQRKFECINETHRTNNELYVHVFDATELAGSRMLFDGILDMQLDSLTKSFQLL